uniref:HTH OST-type domain-containing protein n=1 Tax=Setaria digitata TaxID=48799 RepID=A0A915Q6V4_9BILA
MNISKYLHCGGKVERKTEMSTLDDLKIRIVSVIGSEKNGCTKNDLIRIYKYMYGKDLQLSDHGFSDLDSFLNSPMMKGDGGIVYNNGRYFATGDKNTAKMLELVRNTKFRSAKSRRKSHSAATPSVCATSPYSGSNNAQNHKPLENSQKDRKEATQQMVLGKVDTISKSLSSTNAKTAFYARYMAQISDNQQSRFIAPIQASGIQRRPFLNEMNGVQKDGMLKSQKGRKRLVKLVEQHGGEVCFSELKKTYQRNFSVPLNNTELSRLFGVKEEEIQDLYKFLKTHFRDYIQVTKHAHNDLLLTICDDEDDIDEFENLSVIDTPAQSSLPSKVDDEPEYWKGSTLVSSIRSKDYLPYKVLGDKVLSFVRAKGPFKVSDLSKIFYEEDARRIDPKNYREGTWENVIRKMLSLGGHPELILRDGMLDLRDNQKSMISLPCSSDNWTDGVESEKKQLMSVNVTDNTVPVAAIYDLLVQAGRPLPQKELMEKLRARGIEVNICQLTVKLITKFKDVFHCEFHLSGALISLARGAKRPVETMISSPLPSFTKPFAIGTHVMSDYCSTTESADSLFKPIILVDVALVNEPPNKLRIQASFRLRSHENAYNSFENKMSQHYQCLGQEMDYLVEKPIKECYYAFNDVKDNRVYRVQCLGNGSCAGTVLVYLIDQMRYQDAPVNQLRKLVNDYAKPAYGVVARTSPFIITPGKEVEFHKYFVFVCSKLRDTKEDMQAYIDSEPSKKLFELKQLYTESYADLNVPATFVRQNLIEIFPQNQL